MAVMNRVKFAGGIQANERIDLNSLRNEAVYINADNGDIILRTKDKEISVNSLIDRLAALEEAYMEDKLLGKEREQTQETRLEESASQSTNETTGSRP